MTDRVASIDEITTLLQGLSDAGLDEVRAFVESVRRRELDGRQSAWSFDFTAKFAEASISAARDPVGMEVQVAPAACAGVTLLALWEHPPVTGSGTVAYVVPIPTGLRSVKIKFSIGIRDGAELPPDRSVAFRVLVNGWKLWSAVKNSHAWEEHAIEMPQLGKDVARIEFVTDGLGHHQWDWAVWGMPRLEGQ